MPKVLDKPHNPAALLLSKRPPNKAPQGEQTFDQALQRAQPKHQAAPKRNEPSSAPAPEPVAEAPVEPVDAKPSEADAVESDSLATEAESAQSDVVDEEANPENSDTLEDDQQVSPELLILAIPVQTIELPPESPEIPEEITGTGTISLPAIGMEESDSPGDGLAEMEDEEPGLPTGSVRAAVPTLQDDEASAEDAPVAVASARSVEAPRAVTISPQDPTNIDLPETPLEVAPIGDSDQPETDGEPADSRQPKLVAPTLPGQEEAADESSIAPTPAGVEQTTAKESTLPSDSSRLIDAPAPKAAADTKPVQLQPPPQPPVPARTDSDFAQTNHEKIVSSVRTQLLPNGGSMHIRLDPPELGSLAIHIRMIDGVMQASFETSSDQATRLLSHTLSQLKTALETQGVAVDKLQVQQSPKEHQANAGKDDQQRQSQHQDSQAQREQQRRELMNRMWRRMRLGRDPLDMVA